MSSKKPTLTNIVSLGDLGRQKRRTSYSIFIRGLHLGEYHLGREGPEDHHAELGFTYESERCDGRKTMARTFIPETSIPITNLSLPDFNEVKHTYTQTDVM